MKCRKSKAHLSFRDVFVPSESCKSENGFSEFHSNIFLCLSCFVDHVNFTSLFELLVSNIVIRLYYCNSSRKKAPYSGTIFPQVNSYHCPLFLRISICKSSCLYSGLLKFMIPVPFNLKSLPGKHFFCQCFCQRYYLDQDLPSSQRLCRHFIWEMNTSCTHCIDLQGFETLLNFSHSSTTWIPFSSIQ